MKRIVSVRADEADRVIIKEAAKKARQSMSSFLIVAGLRRAEKMQTEEVSRKAIDK